MEPSCGEVALGVVLLESTRFCAGRRYRSGDDFTGTSNGENARSGSWDVRLIPELGREPITESSFPDGPDEVSDEDVEGDGAWLCR